MRFTTKTYTPLSRNLFASLFFSMPCSKLNSQFTLSSKIFIKWYEIKLCPGRLVAFRDLETWENTHLRLAEVTNFSQPGACSRKTMSEASSCVAIVGGILGNVFRNLALCHEWRETFCNVLQMWIIRSMVASWFLLTSDPEMGVQIPSPQQGNLNLTN